MKDYLERCNDVIRKAEEEIIIKELKRCTSTLLGIMPSAISVLKNVYDEMIENGFNEVQAYEFACKFTMETFFKRNKE
ncbi:hypothetical protein ACQPUY_16910 [Clostridium nigeriense]|uniref:hypothetical protein n=1 Tax=Clostridium nigeriense TaxID=1805470 RepID=UPI003D35163B